MLTILHLDDHVVAIDKPSGLLVHRSAIDRHETRFAVQLLRDQIGRRVYPAHRLDKGTSGILIFTFDPVSAARLGAAFASRDVLKRYLAIVRGYPPEEGLIDHPLSRQHDDIEHRPDDVSHAAQSALTRFRRLATAELPLRVDRYPSSRYALLELEPETGRRHQLRRHLKHVSHPIIGDATYGKGRHNRLFVERFGVNRLLLACTEMHLSHPESGDPLTIRCPPSDDFRQVAIGLGWTMGP